MQYLYIYILYIAHIVFGQRGSHFNYDTAFPFIHRKQVHWSQSVYKHQHTLYTLHLATVFLYNTNVYTRATCSGCSSSKPSRLRICTAWTTIQLAYPSSRNLADDLSVIGPTWNWLVSGKRSNFTILFSATIGTEVLSLSSKFDLVDLRNWFVTIRERFKLWRQ